MKKLTYKFNPYTFARISAMKSLVLKKQDYDKIMKMQPSEIAKFLQERVYSNEINELSIKYSGLKLIENALVLHLKRIMQKLKRISDPSIRYLMIQYLKRYDFYNIKTLIRGKSINKSASEIRELLLPIGSLKEEALLKLYSKGSVREIIEDSGIVKKDDFEEAISKYESGESLLEIENLLDYYYFISSSEFALKIPEQGRLFRDFFRYEIEVYNIMLILKKIFFGLGKKYLEKYIIQDGKDLSKRSLGLLLNAKTYEEFMKEISKTKYSSIFQSLKKEESPLLKSEILLKKFLLKKSSLLYHQHPLSVDLVLGYMFAKEIEASNLRTIIKSKYLDFTEDYVMELIV